MKSIFWIFACFSFLVTCDTALAQNQAYRGTTGQKNCESNTDSERDARQAFSKGIVAFERKDWLEAAYRMLQALDFDCGEELTVVVPYGRWSYKYLPDIYLGIALHRIGHCLMEGRFCSRTRDWDGAWSDFLEKRLGEGWQSFLVDSNIQSHCALVISGHEASPPTALQAVECKGENCLKLRGSEEPYCPVIDWWIKLRKAGADGPLTKTTKQNEERCQGVTTPVEWFWTALRVGEQCTNRRLCDELTAELFKVDNVCGQLEDGARTLGAHYQ